MQSGRLCTVDQYATAHRLELLSTVKYISLSSRSEGDYSPVEPNSDEDQALKNAEAGIKALIAERTDGDW